MHRLLIVEDERWEREGLVELWDWRELGIEVAGTAVDGLDGYEKAVQLRPDIIVTDIRMPGMNGLEMTKRIREVQPNVRIVVLTGYSDFEYTREAIALSADDYVLKPIEEEELRETMLRVAAKCDRALAEWIREAELQERVQAGERIAAERLLSELLLGKREEPERLAAELLALDGGLKAGGYAVMVVASAETSSMEGESSGRLLGDDCWLIDCNEVPQGRAAVVPLDEGEADVDAALRKAEQLLARGGDAWGLTGIGVGTPVASLAQLRDACREAVDAACYGVFYGHEGIVTPDMLASVREREDERSAAFRSRWQELCRELRLQVLALRKPEACEVQEQMFALIRAHAGAGRTYVTTLFHALLLELSTLEDERMAGVDGAGSGSGVNVLDVDRLQELQDGLQQYVSSLIGRLYDKRNRKDDYIAEKAMRLIEQHYGSNALSLTMLAGETFVSSNHLGVLFKKTTGMTVHQYIMDVRMRKAEEMLRGTKRKVSEVAEEIGMTNHSYFCTLFKQKHGMTPGEYQELMQRR